MIESRKGNLLTADVEALVNPVNCVGIMGRGIALQFKQIYPANFRAYEAACKRDEVQPGRMFVFETGAMMNPKYIINFPTKRHWKGKSRIEDIEAGLVALVDEIRVRNIRSIAIPPLGAGLGGLDWSDVRPRIEKAVLALGDVDVVVFEPNGALGPSENKSRDAPNMTPGRAALVGLMHRYLGGLLDPFVSLLEVHKLMYFMQEAGEPLKLGYAKANYGPYAEKLRHVFRAIEGHLVAGYADGGDAPDKKLTLVLGRSSRLTSFWPRATTHGSDCSVSPSLSKGSKLPSDLNSSQRCTGSRRRKAPPLQPRLSRASTPGAITRSVSRTARSVWRSKRSPHKAGYLQQRHRRFDDRQVCRGPITSAVRLANGRRPSEVDQAAPMQVWAAPAF